LLVEADWGTFLTFVVFGARRLSLKRMGLGGMWGQFAGQDSINVFTATTPKNNDFEWRRKCC